MCLLLMVISSCGNRDRATEEFTISTEENNIRISYEGRVPLDDSSHLYIELTMWPAIEPGEGRYELAEFVETGNTFRQPLSFYGRYSTLYGDTPEGRVVQFRNSATNDGYQRTYVAPGFQGSITDSRLRMIRTEPFRTTDLTVRISPEKKLIVLDDQLRPVSLEREFNLVRRNSKLFTLEGYFRHNGDSADFLEMNTGETWPVTKYGDYRKAIRQYHQLTTKKFEMTYLKAVGFSTSHTNKQGREIEALVIKKVLQMTASPTLQEF
jgi:hypothetical protein